MSWGAGVGSLPNSLSPDAVKEQIVLDIGSTELNLGTEVYPLENVEYGVLLKIYYDGSAIGVIKPGLNNIKEKTVYYRIIDIKPPSYTPNLAEIASAEDITAKEAYEFIRSWVTATIHHPLDFVLDVISLYTLYTWFHRFYPKKTFLAVTGFYGTGKSVVGNILKAFGRFTVQTDPGMKTSEWEIALLMGVMLIDEAETLKRSHLAKLRKMHDEGFSVSKMLGAPGGWTVITLHLSSPVVLIGTHLPEDPALISRSIVIKMHYGRPDTKPPMSNSQLARTFRASMIKTVLREWSEYTKKLPEAELKGDKLNMRERDIFTPLCALALHIGRDKLCDSLRLLVKLSSYIAQTITPGKRLATIIAGKILEIGEKVGRFIRIPENQLHELIDEYTRLYKIDPRDSKYVTQYFVSAAYTKRENDMVYLYFLEDDLRVARGEEVDIIEIFKQLGMV